MSRRRSVSAAAMSAIGRHAIFAWRRNIRDVLTARPGIRMLVIVGASHKGYLEAYLQQMHDVRIVDAAPLLR